MRPRTAALFHHPHQHKEAANLRDRTVHPDCLDHLPATSHNRTDIRVRPQRIQTLPRPQAVALVDNDRGVEHIAHQPRQGINLRCHLHAIVVLQSILSPVDPHTVVLTRMLAANRAAAEIIRANGILVQCLDHQRCQAQECWEDQEHRRHQQRQQRQQRLQRGAIGTPLRSLQNQLQEDQTLRQWGLHKDIQDHTRDPIRDHTLDPPQVPILGVPQAPILDHHQDHTMDLLQIPTLDLHQDPTRDLPKAHTQEDVPTALWDTECRLQVAEIHRRRHYHHPVWMESDQGRQCLGTVARAEVDLLDHHQLTLDEPHQQIQLDHRMSVEGARAFHVIRAQEVHHEPGAEQGVGQGAGADTGV